MSLPRFAFPKSAHFEPSPLHRSRRLHELEQAQYHENAIDIIAVPAIGASPGAEGNETWGTSPTKQWLGRLRDAIPHSRLLLYDHLSIEERALSPVDKGFQEAEDEIAKMKIEDFALRLVRVIFQDREWLPVSRLSVVWKGF